MIKSKVSAGAQPKDYPKLMVADDLLIVLFLEYEVGTIIKPVAMRGHHLKTWDMSEFTDFDGSITLSNGSKK